MKKFSDISSTQYIQITEANAQEGLLTKLFRKNDSDTGVGGLLQAFRLSLSSVFDKAVLDGKKDDGIKLSEREKQQLAFAKELQQQTEQELKNELEHEEKLEAAYEELAHRQNMLKLKAEEERKQAERKRELNAVKQTIAKLKTKEGMLKMMTGGPLTEDFVNQILTDADNIVKGVIPAEKELMTDITALVKASMYDKDGKFIGNDGLAKCVDKFSKENPELLKKIQNNDLYKQLSSKKFGGDNEKDFEAFIESNVDRCTPTTAALKIYQDELHSLQDTVKEQHKAIKDNESKIEELKKKRDDAPKKPEVPGFIQTILDKDDADKLSKDDLNALGSGLINDLSIKAKDSKLSDDDREAIRQKLVKLTGDSNIKIEKDDDGTFTVKGGAKGNITKLEPKKDLSVDDVKGELKEYEQQVNDYQKSKEDHKKKVAECNEKIQTLEEQNKETKSVITNKIKEYNKTIKDSDGDFKIDEDNYSEDLTNKVKEADKTVKGREKAIANTKLSIKKVHNTLGRLDNENKADKYAEELKDDKEFQKKLEDIKQGKDKGLFGEEDLYDEEKKVYRIPTGELDDAGKPEYKEIKKEDLEKGKNKEIVERAIYLRTAEIPDNKINELLDAPKPDDEDDEEAMKEWAKKIETGKAMKQAKLHARETLQKEYDISGEKLDEFINADEDFESDEDDDEDDKKDFEGADKSERDEHVKVAKNMSDEEKEKKAKKDKKDLENGDINPANVFKRGRNKVTGKPNKTFRHIYNDKYRISKDEFRKMKARYEEKQAEKKAKKDNEGEGSQSENSSLQIKSLRSFIRESLR